MALQNLLNICERINFNRRKMVGIQYTRNELMRVNETPTYNPWKLTISVPPVLRYNDARSILEDLDTMDRRTPETITFSDNAKLSWMLRYQGGLTVGQRANIVVTSFNTNQLILDVSGVSVSSTTVVLAKGDFIQFQGKPFPFTSTTNVTRGTGSTVTVTTHRPNIITDNITGYGLNWGNDVEFIVFCPNMPTYSLVPGGYVGNGSTTVNNAYIEFSDSFMLYEWIASA
jgi:hypothetical protein